MGYLWMEKVIGGLEEIEFLEGPEINGRADMTLTHPRRAATLPSASRRRSRPAGQPARRGEWVPPGRGGAASPRLTSVPVTSTPMLTARSEAVSTQKTRS